MSELLPELGLLLGSAQHSKAPANFKENPHFPTPCRKHCRTGPLGKDFPKREVFQLGEGPGASQGQEEGDHDQEPGQGNATSWEPLQGPEDTTKLLGGFGTCFLLLWGSFEQVNHLPRHHFSWCTKLTEILC